MPRYAAERTLRKLFDFSIGQHENQNSGIKKSVIDRGQHSLETLAYTFIYDLAPVFLKIIAVIIALLILAPIIGGLVFLGIAVLIGLTIYLNVVFQSDLKKIQDEWHEANKKHSEILRNVSLVKTNAKENEMVKEYDSVLEAVGIFSEKFWTRFISWSIPRSALLYIFRFGVMLAGVFLVYKKVYTPGFLIPIWLWSNGVFSDFGKISGMHRRIMDLYAAIRKYFILLDVESDVQEIPNPIRPKKFAGRIEFKNIYFRYPKREYIIDDKEKKDFYLKPREEEGEGAKAVEKENYIFKNINFSVRQKISDKEKRMKAIPAKTAKEAVEKMLKLIKN